MLDRIIRVSLFCLAIAVVTAVLIIAPAAMQLTMAAENDVLILDDDDDTVISGVITQVDAHSFKMHVNEEEIEVSLKNIDVDDAGLLLKTGMMVTVNGRLHNNILEAEKVLKTADEVPAAAPVVVPVQPAAQP